MYSGAVPPRSANHRSVEVSWSFLKSSNFLPFHSLKIYPWLRLCNKRPLAVYPNLTLKIIDAVTAFKLLAVTVIIVIGARELFLGTNFHSPKIIHFQNFNFDQLRTCFLDRRSFWNFTSEATINKMFMCRWKSLKLMSSGNFKRF